MAIEIRRVALNVVVTGNVAVEYKIQDSLVQNTLYNSCIRSGGN